jgi:hypothetical protein
VLLMIHMSPVSLYTVVKDVGCSHKWKKNVIYVPAMEHFVNSIPEHVSTPESYHSMTHQFHTEEFSIH